MNRLEDQLREAMRRQPAPEGFAERVLRAAESRPEVRAERDGFWTRLGMAFQGPRLRWTAAFAAAVMVFAAVGIRNQRERAEGERAKQQLMLALQITGGKLSHVRAAVYRTSQPEE
jgi:hypothetical protein